MTAVEFRRIDPTRSMRRFCRLVVQYELFGCFLLLKQRGCLGARGRIMAERSENEPLAVAALQKQVVRKQPYLDV